MKRVVIIGVVAGLTAIIASVAIVVGGALPWSQEDTEKEMSHARGWLGVRIAQINRSLADRYDLTVDSGVVVVEVQDGGPADAAGMEAGDVFKSIGGTTVEEVDEAVDAVGNLEPWTEATIAVVRGKDDINLRVTLGEPEKPVSSFRYAIPGSLLGLGMGFPDNLVQAEMEMLEEDGDTVTVGVTAGTVQSATDDSITIVRRDDKEVTFRATDYTKVIVGGRSINMSGLKQDTTVMVATEDGDLSMVVAWPGYVYPFGGRLFWGGDEPGVERFSPWIYGEFPGELSPSMEDRIDDLLEKRFKSKDEWKKR